MGGGRGKAGTYEETEAEHADQGVLLTPAEVQLSQRREREDKNDDVGDDVAGGVDVPEGQVRDASSGQLGQPELGDGRAVEGGDEQLRDGPQADKDRGVRDDAAHLACPQDAVVLQEEGGLDERQRGVVQHDGDVESLRES